ncbi:uncharacterized protein Z519_09520 [Cladophialophora bantiana CBS 173.52]|uniref:SMP domain-containing protein n=1 Tax=Cladophialophora bantiana (strain ATCC 10958 / CBS 173.52 / CDC B-1940 / NIH 8579) TaxID=1442370 RepID=A0A0D2HZT3_CLAB1|nr:uncharacterized protein Z519_09520 [Cladophialophora bantiana CBS 173.52]KIW90089.1 hypothetical protein Z519_09520 [Cladophialophora bantiana CBS 173.52]
MKPLRLQALSLGNTVILRAPTTPFHRVTSVSPIHQHQQQIIPPTNTRHQSSTTTTQCQQDIQSNRSAQQDRTRIDRQPTEYSKSGTDDAVASQAVSFSPDSTSTADPAESIAQAAEQIQNLTASTTGTSNVSPTPPQNAPFNPLEVSPANVEISSTTSEIEGVARTAQGGVQEQSKTYVGTTTQKSKSTRATATTEEKGVFAGSDKRKDGMPGAAVRGEVEGGRGPIFRPGSR